MKTKNTKCSYSELKKETKARKQKTKGKRNIIEENTK
jgi:hypothetical protein